MFERFYRVLRANLHAAAENFRAAASGTDSGGSRQSDSARGTGSSGTHSSGTHSSGTGSSGGYSRSQSRQEQAPPGQDARIAQFYANLELPYGADLDAVRSARKRLLRKYHPDRFHGNDDESKVAQELTQEINRAHDELVKWLKMR